MPIDFGPPHRSARENLPVMEDLVTRLLPATILTLVVAVRAAVAGPGDDQYAVAAGHYSQSRWELAVEEFTTFLAGHPYHPRRVTARFYLAEALMQLGRFQAARDSFRDVLSQDSQSDYARRAAFRLGETSYFTGDLPQAIDQLRRFRQDHPGDELNAYAEPYLADALLRSGDAQAARQLFNESLEKYPQGPLQHDCRYGLAQAALALGDRQHAARLYQQVAETSDHPLADDALFQWAASLYEAGEYTQAVEAFNRLSADFPDSPLRSQATMATGWACYQLKQYELAIKRFENLADHQDLAMQARLWSGLAQRALQRWPSAAETLRAATELNPRHELTPMLLYYAGDALLRDGQPRRSGELFDRVLTDWPDDPWTDECLVGKLNVAVALADHDEALRLAEEFRRVHTDSPLLPDVHRMLGQSHLKQQQYERAEQLLAPLVEQTATAHDRYLLAEALKGLARYDDALTQLAAAENEGDESLQNDARRLRASILFLTSRDDEAISAFEQLLKSESDPQTKAACQARLCVSCARRGRWDEARSAFAQFEQSEPAAELLLPTAEQLAEAAYAVSDYQWAGDLFAILAERSDGADTQASGLSGLAWCRYKSGQLPQASDLFARLAAEHPNHPAAARGALARGAILERLEQPDAALASYQTVIEAAPEGPHLPEALLAAAQLQVRLSQPAEAEAAYRRLVEQHATWEHVDTALYRWAWLLEDSAEPAAAAALFDRLHKEFPKSEYWADATYRIAQRALTQNDLDRAEKLSAAVVESAPGEELLGHALFLQGQVAAARGDYGEVETLLARLIATSPDHPVRLSAEYWLAEAAYRDGRYPTAGQRFAALGERTRGRDEAWLAMVPLRQAQVAAHGKQWQDALRIASEIESAYPNFEQRYEADYLIGRCHAALGDFQLARESYNKVLRCAAADKTETQAMAQWMIGETFFHQNNYHSALKEYLRVEILYAYPAWQAAALLQAAKCHEQLGQWREAAELYSRLVEQYADQQFAEEAARRLREARRQVQQSTRS